MGPGDESYISFSKGEGDGEWRYGFSLHDEARSSGGGTTTDVDFDFEAPQWCSAIIMRQRVNPLRRIFARGGKWAARLELQLGRNMEGMPVYRSTTDVGERGDADWWIVSKGGRWHYGASAGVVSDGGSEFVSHTRSRWSGQAAGVKRQVGAPLGRPLRLAFEPCAEI